MEAKVDGRLAVRRTFFRAHQVDWALRVAEQDLAAGRLPWISFKFPHSWSEMATGRGDAWARDIARRLARLDGHVWVAFHHEPENDGNIRLWTRTQERLAPIVRSSASNVAYTVILMGYHQVNQGQLVDKASAYSLDNLWPDTKIDVLGIDPYNYYGAAGKPATAPTDIVSKYFKPISRWAARNDIQWGVAEIGYTNKTQDEDPRWLQRTHQGLVDHHGVAFSYFNSSLNSVADWRLDTPADFRAFKEVLAGSPRVTD